ncbi:MAG: glycogen debranching protein GlgX [Cyclobacteriaceae bacterium]|jgi:isoamylase|nr:glycogen debranching protein GlgX [Cyclobacteriaceae bacterium]
MMATKAKQDTGTYAGQSFPQGASVDAGGINFCIFSRNCHGVDLLLFNNVDDLTPSRTITLDPQVNRTYHYWHVFVPGLQEGQLYGYRVRGEYDPKRGHRFDSEKVLLDPYAHGIVTPKNFNRTKNATDEKSVSPFMKSVVTNLKHYNWENDKHPKRPFSQTVIYEMHVSGFTKNPNSGVTPALRGTYKGLIEKIPYLVDLGITAVELLPVFHFDNQDSYEGRNNYWGYSPISFFAPQNSYSTTGNPQDTLNEFRDMVKALHRAGIEIILDVVFNHTAEGGEGGPTYSFRGIDNSIYYTLEKDKSHYANYSGCGNTLNANQPIVRRMIIDSLQFWVNEMHVDGFRFDLASILSRDGNGHPIENPPVLWDIESDPMLAGTKLIAEAWDAAGLYQVGTFIGDSWKEWNGKFRDDVRQFMRGDSDTVGRFVTRMMGSPDIYGAQNREPEQSINFITCHDGFTLNDLVSYNTKHNEANGEDNRDGSNDNYSYNYGIEGPTDDPAIEKVRQQQIKNLFAATLFSIGAPMILMGDEVRRTQLGNNNAYCHDNELTWFDWNLVKKNKELYRFVKMLIYSRLKRDSSQEEFSMSLREILDKGFITWHGIKLNEPDWSAHSHSIAFTIQSLSGQIDMHFMINAFTESLDFELPVHFNGKKCQWHRWIDTFLPSPDDIVAWSKAPLTKPITYSVNAHAVVVLISSVNGKII